MSRYTGREALVIGLFVALVLAGAALVDAKRQRAVPRDHPSHLTGGGLCW